MLFAVDGAAIVRCQFCQLVRQAVRPDSESQLYSSSYYVTDDPKGGYANYFLDSQINRATFQDRARRITLRYGRVGRLLDVGSALGDFLIEAQLAGWDAQGIEVSAFAAQEAMRRGLRVGVGDLRSLRLPAESYDVVTLYDTLEHLSDPLAALAEIRRILVPGGLVHIVTPNVASMQARLLGRRWYHYKPGEHIYYFSPYTLRKAVERANLEWESSQAAASYVTVAYVLNRLRYYARTPFGVMERIARKLHLDRLQFRLDVAEFEAWVRSRPGS